MQTNSKNFSSKWNAESASRKPRDGEILLDIRDLTVTYGDGAITALHQVDLQVHRGEIVALLGVNGAGKSTLLRAITGLLPSHNGAIRTGEILYQGESLRSVPPWKRVTRGISISLEGRRVFPKLTVEDNLRAGGYTKSRKTREQIMTGVMDVFPRLAQKQNISAGLLSGGEQQMLAVGRALMQEPELLLLDEPSLGLAPKIVEQIRDIIVEINQTGCAVLLIEQNTATALSIADYAYILGQHEIQHQGTGPDIRNDPRLMNMYLGTPTEEVTVND